MIVHTFLQKNTLHWLPRLLCSFSTLKPERSKNFEILKEKDVSYFRTFMNDNEIIYNNAHDLIPYNTDWLKITHGNSLLVLQPTQTSQVYQILYYCQKNRLAVVPYGGNTGLAGGCVPVHDEIILSMRKMNKIEKYDEYTNVITVYSGCVLEALNNYLKPYASEVPLDIGSRGSCLIGGNISTHAGGKYFIKYGPFRCNILGLEAVLPDGRLLDMSCEIRKDNTGIDLKYLFIGSEGILGIITKANILCWKLEKFRNLFAIKTDSYDKVLKIHKVARNTLGHNLSALEWMDGHSYQVVQQTMGKVVIDPFSASSTNDADKNHYVFIELYCNYDIESLENALFEQLTLENLYIDIIKAENEYQYNAIWMVRDVIAEAAGRYGEENFAYDFSLDPKMMDAMACDLRKKVGGIGIVVAYGHIGDSNLHLNAVCHKALDKAKMEAAVEPYVYEWMRKLNGSISAEHGLGIFKKPFLNYYKDDKYIGIMRNIKRLVDPVGILNPYKVI